MAAKEESQPSFVCLNVGGVRHITTPETISAAGGDHMLAALVSERVPVIRDDQGYIVIDRDGRLFHVVLNFLRDGSVVLPSDEADLEALAVEARYYLLPDLARQATDRLRTVFLSGCHVPMILDERDERRLVASTRAGTPAVRFSCNRQNNRFSYKTGGEDALLKNIELFDKLATRFRGRVLYTKDCCGRGGDICTWYFYGRGRLLAEVCCTALVYTADRKQIKIEFPEARLYEENMNLLLYEPGAADLEEEAFAGPASTAHPTLSGIVSSNASLQAGSIPADRAPRAQENGYAGSPPAYVSDGDRHMHPMSTLFPIHDAEAAPRRLALGSPPAPGSSTARRSSRRRDSAI